jgi:hypothetical protein
MLEFLIPCHECKDERGHPKYNPFPTLDLGERKPANPAGSPTDNWSVLFLCPRCGLVSLYADGEIKKFDVDPDPNNPAVSHLYSISFACGTGECPSQLTVYATARGRIKAATEARTKAQIKAQGKDIKNRLETWHFDSSVLCEKGHPPQKPTRDAVDPVLRGELVGRSVG